MTNIRSEVRALWKDYNGGAPLQGEILIAFVELALRALKPTNDLVFPNVHRARCVLHGCYYGLATQSDACVYCGGPRPRAALGVPVLQPILHQLRDPNHVDGLSPERHDVRAEKHFGDWYGVCSCGARSLPHITEELFNLRGGTWVCPRLEAERQIERSKALWAARVAAAHDSRG